MSNKRNASRIAPPRRILVPCDFSDCSRAALDYAVALAGKLDASVTLLHVIEPVQTGFLIEAPVSRQSQGAVRERALKELGAWVSRWAPGVRTGRPLVKAGKPWDVVVAVARTSAADLVVMGTHGHTGLKHAVLGSVAERVVRHASCPVLTLRGTN